MNNIRALRADEIECRIASVGQKGCQLLLYKDARCDKRILDEVYGPLNWQDRYEEIKGNLYCSVGVYDEKSGQWVWKQDCGTESFAEKEKGEASDAFKRACFNWGIGRELYTKIFIFIPGGTELDETASKKAGKDIYRLKNKFIKFNVSHIETDNEREVIKSLTITDDEGCVAFTWPKKKKEEKLPPFQDKPPADNPSDKKATKTQMDKMKKALIAKFGNLQNSGGALQDICAEFGYEGTAQIKACDMDAIIKKIEEYPYESTH